MFISWDSPESCIPLDGNAHQRPDTGCPLSACISSRCSRITHGHPWRSILKGLGQKSCSLLRFWLKKKKKKTCTIAFPPCASSHSGSRQQVTGGGEHTRSLTRWPGLIPAWMLSPECEPLTSTVCTSVSSARWTVLIPASQGLL